MDDNGLVTVRSAVSVRETVDRIVATVSAHGLIVFARIDHGDGAARAGLALRPTELVIFGHPRGGTPLMQDSQTAGLDLPIRALAWEDADGAVWLTYERPAWLAARHGLGAASAAAVEAIAAGLDMVAKAATAT
ncbi:MAG TPA: DUF302 domain-containing protein [Hyphomicrobiales bacterium]|nr:DUF302 domain-containing protein [Hyphomicrobiales bacterium]